MPDVDFRWYNILILATRHPLHLFFIGVKSHEKKIQFDRDTFATRAKRVY